MANKRKAAPSSKKPGGDLSLIQLAQRFSTEEAARDYFEGLRWPDGPVCPHCGNADKARVYKVTPNPAKKIRAGLYKCAECLQSFTVTVGTVCEDSHIPLNKWLVAFYMMCASKMQVSVLQLQRQLEIGSYRSAWHLCHRMRFALQDIMPTDKLEGTVETDEAHIRGVKRGVGQRYTGDKMAVGSIAKRGGRVRSQAVERVTDDTLGKLLKQHIGESIHMNTDEAPVYQNPGKASASHDVVDHNNEEYARRHVSGRLATMNTAEGFLEKSKRALDGTHYQVSAKYHPLYLAEFDYKYSFPQESDGARTSAAIPKIVGKGLMPRRPKGRL